MYGAFLAKKKSVTVSIITPCYNAENYIEDTIKSILYQNFKNWELIIIDDLSSDNSAKIINKFVKKDSRIKLIKLSKRSGQAYARNKGINLAKGRFLTFIDSDDYWGPNFLKYSLEKIKKHEFIFSNYFRVDEEGKIIDKIISVSRKVNSHGVLKGTPISCLTAFIDLKKIGKKFFPTNVYREDIAYWLLLLKVCNEAHGFVFCEAYYRYRKNSSSVNKIKMAIQTWSDYRNSYKLNLIKSLYYFLHYAINGLYKTYKFHLFKSKKY